ncbi:ParB/RepB/Spo0J family partition protein [Paraburkholderia adhaesiva]|uniref:ParB/RepB/Spo0J family partition protein n=1 Tax=Paraburkholderia adhaesiva TaxID=2883244 RepID=UPI001F3831BC|nr:ParB N-terminal domain-containing protein [Paraburkholderia adhaesiva]
MDRLELHPLCALFPVLQGDRFDELCADIRAHGLREPIVTLDGRILDGGNRYRACIEAGVEPRTVPFGDGDALAFVLSANLHRRHLSAGQQAAIVAAATDWQKAHARGGDGSNQHGRKEQTGNTSGLLTVGARAAQSGASERTQRLADKVAKANPALAKKVAHGEITLPQAAQAVAHGASASRSSARHVAPRAAAQEGPQAPHQKRTPAGPARTAAVSGKETDERGVPLFCTYARLLLVAMRARTVFSDEERDLIAQIGEAIRQLGSRLTGKTAARQ